jgi:ABC-type lipoprotein export system ATPase subunit
MTTPAVTFERVSRTYRRGAEEVRALVEVDLTVGAGEFTVVTGPSGAGKSTLLHLAGGLDVPDTGRVAAGDVDISTLSDRQGAAWRRRHVGFVFQFFNLVPHLSAVENVSLPLLLDGVAPAVADRRARDLLVQIGLGGLAGRTPAGLSGGQMQRVALARAAVTRPSLLLADEPTGNLDSESGAAVVRLLRDLNREHGCTVVVVTHEPALAQSGDVAVHLRDGRVQVDRPGDRGALATTGSHRAP